MEDIIFKSIAKTGQGLYKEKGSKFHGATHQIKNEEEVKAIVQNLWDQNNGACHVCYAYQIGPEKKIVRSNDDGEPSNSAGPPILAQIQKHDLTNTLITVVRYYGGTNLGVGGLINAYRTAAEEAIAKSKIEETCLKATITLEFDYPEMSDVMNIIKVNNLQPKDQQFETNCIIIFETPYSEIDTITGLFERLEEVSVKVEK